MADTTVKKIICSSCGAEFEDTLPKCPYCGSLNYKGAEAEYLGKLESMRQDMHDIGQVLSFQGNGAGGTGILVIGHEQAILQETAGIQDQDRGVRHDFQGPARTGITQNTCLFQRKGAAYGAYGAEWFRFIQEKRVVITFADMKLRTAAFVL